MTTAVTCRLIAFWLMALAAATTLAHDGPEDVIARLNVQLLRSGPSSDLLFRRACEFRALRQYERAAADLQHALKLNAALDAARLELARLQLWAMQHPTESELGSPATTIEPLTRHSDPDLRTAAIALRGKIHLATGDYSAAADDFTTALQRRPDLEWYLWRADAQQQIGQLTLAIAGLREGLAETASPVLQTALCELLIEVAEAATHSEFPESLREARTIIESELSDSRVRSAWLIRRARLVLIEGAAANAQSDLAEAMAELDTRLTTQRPDPQLLEQREQAQRLLTAAGRLLANKPPAQNSAATTIEQEQTRAR